MPTGICIAKVHNERRFLQDLLGSLLHFCALAPIRRMPSHKETSMLIFQLCSGSGTARIRTFPQKDATIKTDPYEAVATTNTLVDLTAKTQGAGFKLESGCASRSARSKRGSWVTQPSVLLSLWPEWISGIFQRTSYHPKLSPSSVSRIQAYEWAQHSDFVGAAVCASHPTL